MRGSTWALVLGIVGLMTVVARAVLYGKSNKPMARTPVEPEAPGSAKVVIDGEEVELESISDEELERIALQAKEPDSESSEDDEAGDWRDVLADPNSVSRRRKNGEVVDLKSAAALLIKTEIPCRVAPSQDSLLGLRTLQVHENDFERAVELLRSEQYL